MYRAGVQAEVGAPSAEAAATDSDGARMAREIGRGVTVALDSYLWEERTQHITPWTQKRFSGPKRFPHQGF